ncbi:MAG: phosphoribosylformylglycinamidine cyclo-ligase [Acidiferrobacterales bacterium]
MSKSGRSPFTYRDAGVDIDAGEALVQAIKPIAAATARPGTLGELGGFGGCFALAAQRYREPVLVASTDGVGTKVKLAIQTGHHAAIGIDLVAMCANDIIVQGAEPLFFLDYFATGKLETAVVTTVIEGIAEGCRQAGMALIGGETAEMPGVYTQGNYDLAGFAVGIVERSKLIDGSAVTPGDALIGLASSGPHANGYSLIRKILDTGRVSLDTTLADKSLAEVLLSPTRIYVRSLMRLFEVLPVHALAHITGGGLTGNLPRVLPAGVSAVIDASSWSRHVIFDWLQEHGNVEDAEMYRIFNCGVGMVIIVGADTVDAAVELVRRQGETVFVIGTVERQIADDRVIIR